MALRRRLWVRPDSGLTWSMNCESWLVPKNSLMEATTGRMLISVCGVMASTSCVVMRSRTTRSIRARPRRTWFWISSPTVRRRRLPKWSMSSVSTGTTRPARTQLAIDVEQRVVLPGGVVLLQGDAHGFVVAPALEDAGVVPAERLEQNGDALLALAVDANADVVALVDFELKPCTPGGNH